MGSFVYNSGTLDHSCNKWSDLIGQKEVSISHRYLQILIDTCKFLPQANSHT